MGNTTFATPNTRAAAALRQVCQERDAQLRTRDLERFRAGARDHWAILAYVVTLDVQGEHALAVVPRHNEMYKMCDSSDTRLTLVLRPKYGVDTRRRMVEVTRSAQWWTVAEDVRL